MAFIISGGGIAIAHGTFQAPSSFRCSTRRHTRKNSPDRIKPVVLADAYIGDRFPLPPRGYGGQRWGFVPLQAFVYTGASHGRFRMDSGFQGLRAPAHAPAVATAFSRFVHTRVRCPSIFLKADRDRGSSVPVLRKSPEESQRPRSVSSMVISAAPWSGDTSKTDTGIVGGTLIFR